MRRSMWSVQWRTPIARLYYRFYRATSVGDKYVCVVVKSPDEGGFVVTAYLTDRIKRGYSYGPRQGEDLV